MKKTLIVNWFNALHKFLCDINVHHYKYYNETHKIIGLGNRTQLNVPIRECVRCGKKEHHLMPKCNGIADNWKPFPYKKDDILIANDRR